MKTPILTLSLIALLSGGINNSYSQDSKSSENSKLVIYGESNHMSKKQKEFMINSVDSLKKQGYNYFALELPVERDSSIQRYLASNKNYLDAYIKKALSWECINGTLEVAYNFYKNGFKIIPIDEGDDRRDKNDGIYNPYGIYKPNAIIKVINERDSCMAKNIEKILENDSSAKIIVYIGSFHARENGDSLKLMKLKREGNVIRKYSTMAKILKKNGINPETICLTEDDNGINENFENFDKIIYVK